MGATAQKDKKKTSHGRGIKAMRGLTGITQEGLGLMIGMSPKQVFALELKDEIEKETIQKVADALGVPPEWIQDFDPRDLAKSLTFYGKVDHKNEPHETSNLNDNSNNNINDQNNTYVDTHSVEMLKELLLEKDKQLENKNQEILQLTSDKAKLEAENEFLKKAK